METCLHDAIRLHDVVFSKTPAAIYRYILNILNLHFMRISAALCFFLLGQNIILSIQSPNISLSIVPSGDKPVFKTLRNNG